MDIVTRELLAGPAPAAGGPKEFATYFLQLARIEELGKRRLTAIMARQARSAGLSNREIGDVLGHTEGWVRQYLKDTAGKTEAWEFADAGFRGNFEEHNQFYKDMMAAKDFEQRLHLCAEYGLSDAAVAQVLSITRGRASQLMEGPRAEAAA